jgi:hypothetical protein
VCGGEANTHVVVLRDSRRRPFDSDFIFRENTLAEGIFAVAPMKGIML